MRMRVLFVVFALVFVAACGSSTGFNNSRPDLPTTDDGWTEFELHDDGKIIYVSSSEGSDDNDGLSVDEPVETPSVAMSLAAPGDWIFFKRGDAFEDLPVAVSGIDAEHPTVVGAYGDESMPRPQFHHGFNATAQELMENVAWVSLHLYTRTHDPESGYFDQSSDNGGISFNQPFRNLLFEDVLVEFGQMNFQGWEEELAENLTLRRSIFAFSWNDDGHAQGVFMNHVDGVLVEECVFDHNGHYPGLAEPTKFNHNIYVQSSCNDIVFRNNITARASSHGFQLRPHGIAEGNLSIGNALAGFVAYDNASSDAVQILRGNVALHGVVREFSGGGTVGFQMWGGEDGAIFAENILAHAEEAREALEVPEDYEVDTTGNIIYQWDDYGEGGGNYSDPERTIMSYHESIGGDPSIEAFMQGARAQRKGDWATAYTAQAVIDYIRDGFEE